MKLQIVFFVASYIYFSEAASDDYNHIGCFKDTFFRAMSEKLGDVKSVDHCANRVRRKGYSTFGVQYGKECYSAAAAANTYKVFGLAVNCRNGMGGEWANDVYQFKEGTYQRLGCWEDKSTRALPKLLGRFYRDAAVRTCADYTRAKGWSIFGVQANTECWGGENHEANYTKYNKSSDCADDGTGGPYRNEVYRLPAQKCLKCNGNDNCTKVTCSSKEPYCYKLSADQDTGGVVSRVTVAGCMSDCTSAGESDLCKGKENCHASCCSYENCNDPNETDEYPKCYACKSTTSAADCKANQYVVPCSKVDGALSYCYTAQKNGTYWKACHDGNKCTIEGGVMSCCTGYKCNGAINVPVSVFLIMACALIKVIL